MRALFNKDIATGLENTGLGYNYSSEGPSDTLQFKNEQFEQPLQFCYTLDPGSTCTEEQIEGLLEGNVTVCRYIVKDRNSTVLFPELMGRLEDEGCGSGGNGGGNGNGTVGGGNGTVGGGVPVPSEGGAGKIAVPVGMMVVGLLAFAGL
jgi:hypothetical protein